MDRKIMLHNYLKNLTILNFSMIFLLILILVAVKLEFAIELIIIILFVIKI